MASVGMQLVLPTAVRMFSGHSRCISQGCGQPARQFGHGWSVEGQYVRQYSGVGLGMGQLKGPAEHVANLVVQSRPCRWDCPLPLGSMDWPTA